MFSLTIIQKGFIVVAAACSILFVLFFFGLVFNVLRHMRIKGRALPVMQESRRLFYQVALNFSQKYFSAFYYFILFSCSLFFVVVPFLSILGCHFSLFFSFHFRVSIFKVLFPSQGFTFHCPISFYFRVSFIVFGFWLASHYSRLSLQFFVLYWIKLTKVTGSSLKIILSMLLSDYPVSTFQFIFRPPTWMPAS